MSFNPTRFTDLAAEEIRAAEIRTSEVVADEIKSGKITVGGIAPVGGGVTKISMTGDTTLTAEQAKATVIVLSCSAASKTLITGKNEICFFYNEGDTNAVTVIETATSPGAGHSLAKGKVCLYIPRGEYETDGIYIDLN